MDVLARLEETRRSINVLEHPFYERWTAGELSAGELTRYAGEYRHAVGALAQASRLAADTAPADLAGGLLRHAEEEAAHVALWDQFARATGASGNPADPLPETRSCVEAWTAGDEVLEHLAVLYAIEGGQPEVSRTKLAGLADHYGYSREGPASEYFRLHEQLDVEHARQAGELIGELMATESDPAGTAERMLGRARAALQGNWTLLDGVQAPAQVPA